MEAVKSPTNRLLAGLPKEELDRLQPYLQPIMVSSRQVLTGPDEPSRHAYFVNRGIISLIMSLEEGFQIEVAMVGSEGMVNPGIVLGATSTPLQALSQVTGEVLRIDAAVLKRLAEPGTALYAATTRYLLALKLLMAQTAACNCVHHVRRRLCKWLLMAHDRADADQFSLSHDFIAQMLGVRRPTITVVAGRLQKSKLIRYHRGHVTVMNRRGLEGCSCECYGVIRREFDRLLRNGRA
jgi:CRP-like cAMP-binding protein